MVCTKIIISLVLYMSILIKKMKTSYRNTFEQIYTREPSTDLSERINQRITHARSVRAQRKAYAYGGSFLITLVALIPMIQYLSAEAVKSGLYSYMSLFISDSSYMFSNIKISMLSIFESIPMTSVVLTLVIILLTTYSLKKSLVYIKTSNLSLAKI